MTDPDQITAAIKATTELVAQSVAERDARMVHELTDALRAEGIADDVAARVLNRICTGVPDPDQVTRPDNLRRSFPTFGDGTMRPQAGGT